MTRAQYEKKGFKINQFFDVNGHKCRVNTTFGRYFQAEVDGQTLCTRGLLETCFKKIINYCI